MDKINKVLNSRVFNQYITKLNYLERDRKFCRHSIEHSLDVARIAYIKVLEQGLDYSKEIIYISSLLHDLGRVFEYEKNISHNVAGVNIAKEILDNISFSEDEKILIINSILKHRKKSAESEYYEFDKCSSEFKKKILCLSNIIRESDKLSRCCFCCSAQDECYWDGSKKNKGIKY